MPFREIGVSEHACSALARQGIVEPNPVQQAAIPPLMTGRDAVIHAPTGSGKTLAYLLPLIRRLSQGSGSGPRALIVAPTRELATQIDAVLKGLGTRLRSALVFGGVPYGNQTRALRSRPDIVIGCPGRLLDVIGRGALTLGRVEYLVLDESDEMLDQGFAPDVERLIALTPATRQTVLASATMPDWVRTMIARHLQAPEIIRVERQVEPALEHALLAVSQPAKTETLDRLLSRHNGQAIVFHRTKHGAKKLARDLNRLGHAATELQGNLTQNARDRAMTSFRSGRSSVLVATDVAARGIDVAEVGLVVNFELPQTAEWLTHRVGRTARNGVRGRALTFVTPEDAVKWSKLRRQGAPDLAHVDVGRLLDSGEWSCRHQETRPRARSNGFRSGIHRDGPAEEHTGSRTTRSQSGSQRFRSRRSGGGATRGRSGENSSSSGTQRHGNHVRPLAGSSNGRQNFTGKASAMHSGRSRVAFESIREAVAR